MTWFKVDDTLAFHAKVAAAGNAAMGLWVRAGSWSAQQLTDGYVPEHIALTLGTRQEVKRLVEVRLWVEKDGGYLFWQWHDGGRQPSRMQVEADREAARERQRRAREKAKSQRESRRDIPRDDAVTHAPVTPLVTVPPTRPDPTRPDQVHKHETSSRGGRLPEPFEITAEMRRWAQEAGYDEASMEHVTAAFCDYWRAAPGAKGRKSDWPATWRNWLRREAERRPQRGGDGGGFIGVGGVLYDEGLA